MCEPNLVDKKETVQIVSASWIEAEGNQLYCYWPPQNQTNKARKHQIHDKDK